MATAAPKLPMVPLQTIEALSGAVHVHGDVRTFVVTLTPADGSGLRQFEIETAADPTRAIDWSAKSADVYYWMGHLVVAAPQERKALHVSVKGVERLLRPRTDGPQLDSASALAELDALLSAGNDLTRVETATSIVSKNEKALKVPEGIKHQAGRMDTDYQDYGSGGLGTCGSSCSTSCGDGSSCSATCSSPRCAHCSCPASCTCS
jgi:hypothetical protein